MADELKFTESDRRAFDIWFAEAEKVDPARVDEIVRRKCAELEFQFPYNQEEDCG